jgi:hypothetical protein
LQQNPGTEHHHELHPETVRRFVKDNAIEEEEIIDSSNINIQIEESFLKMESKEIEEEITYNYSQTKVKEYDNAIIPKMHQLNEDIEMENSEQFFEQRIQAISLEP